MGIQPLVGDAQGCRNGRRIVGDHGGAIGARDHEAFAALTQRVGNPVQLRLRRRQEHAELVATHPVRDPHRSRGGRKLCREAGEQGIAGGMSEGVVVRLEAVQVEEGQHPPLAGAYTIELVLQVEEELAPVGEAREGISQRLVAARFEQLVVLPEAKRGPREDEHDRGAR